MRLKGKKTEDFNVYTADQGANHICNGCYFFEHGIDCTVEDAQDYLNKIFSKYPGNKKGSCKGLIAKYEPEKTILWHEKEKVCTP